MRTVGELGQLGQIVDKFVKQKYERKAVNIERRNDNESQLQNDPKNKPIPQIS